MGPSTQISSSIDRRWPEHLALLQALVSRPTTLGHEREAQQIVFRHLRQVGMSAEMYDLDLGAIGRHPQFAPTEWSYQDRPNVSGVWRGSGGGRSLVLNGHIDVVSPEPAGWWTYDPWGATVVADRMYGRGALDMKGGLVAALMAIHALKDAGTQLRGDLSFECVIEEECTGNGMLGARLRSGRVDGAVIPELTGLRAWTATPGVVWFEVAVRGKAAYVGQAGAYVNANETAAALIARLKPPMVAELNALPRHPAFAAFDQPFALSVGTIAGGDWPTNVPLECRFTCRMAYPIGWTFAQVQGFIERHLSAAAAGDPWLSQNPPAVRFPGFRALGWAIDEQAPLIQMLDACHQSIIGKPLERGAFAGTADARYFDRASGEQAVYYGPSGSNQHAPDEYVELDSIRQTAQVLAQLAVEWCA